MAHTWDQEMMRLDNLIDELEKQNAELRGMLSKARGLCNDALAQQATWEMLEGLVARDAATCSQSAVGDTEDREVLLEDTPVVGSQQPGKKRPQPIGQDTLPPREADGAV